VAPAELPVGVVTALLGGPFFLFLLRRSCEACDDAAVAADGVSFAFGERQVLADVSLELASRRAGGGARAERQRQEHAAAAAGRPRRATGRRRPPRRGGSGGVGRRAVARGGARAAGSRVEYAFTALEVTLMGRARTSAGSGCRARATSRSRATRWRASHAAALAERPLDELSGGERQRIFLARALARSHTSSARRADHHLDVRNQLDVHAVVRALCREQGLACVTVVHDLNLAMTYCDRVLVLAGGRVAAAGPPARALTAECVAQCSACASPRGASARRQAGAGHRRKHAGPFARPGASVRTWLFRGHAFSLRQRSGFFRVWAAALRLMLGLGLLLRPRTRTRPSFSTYECGEPPSGSAWINFNIRFYLIALVFVIFDVELAFIYPVMAVYRTGCARRGRGRAARDRHLHRHPGRRASSTSGQGRPGWLRRPPATCASARRTPAARLKGTPCH
jgi:iron complex transport system ATP-binding protein